jgi:hypothetical protein
MSPSASKATPERMTAPTLCGSVTWSSTTSGPAIVAAQIEQVAEPDVGERIDLDHQPLMRRVVRHQPAEIGDIGKGGRDGRIERQRGERLARAPHPADGALRIGEGRDHGVAAPEAGAAGRRGRWAMSSTHDALL